MCVQNHCDIVTETDRQWYTDTVRNIKIDIYNYRQLDSHRDKNKKKQSDGETNRQSGRYKVIQREKDRKPQRHRDREI